MVTESSDGDVSKLMSEIKVPRTQYAVKAVDLQRVRIPPGQSVARPEATRAAQEVTNALKYSV